MAGVPGVPPGVPAALAGVAGRMSTTGLPGFAAMTPGPVSWAGCAVAATAGGLILRQRKRRILGRCLHMARLFLRRRNVALLGERKLLRRGFTLVPPAPPLKLALDVLFTTMVLL